MSALARAVVTGMLAVGVDGAFAAERETLPWEEARRFVEALETLRAQYVEPVDDAMLLNEAIRGMAAGLDPYSAYLDPLAYEQARANALGRYEGIGVEVSRIDGGYVIVTPFDGGPAARAGLKAGDVLLAANGESLAGLDVAQLDALLHGETGTSITLAVQRGDGEPFEVALTRELVSIPSVTGRRLAGDIVYVRLALFSDTSATDLEQLLTQLDAAHARGVILDLRNNGGGVIDGAVATADLFLDDGIIVATRGRAPGQNADYAASAGDIVAGRPMIVLVNAGTASAAEILAGALQDHGRAIVAGATTFGKGVVQSLIPLEGGGALQITTARYTTPSGRVIDAAGIAPDIEMPDADDAPGEPETDALVQRALHRLQARPAGRQP